MKSKANLAISICLPMFECWCTVAIKNGRGTFSGCSKWCAPKRKKGIHTNALEPRQPAKASQPEPVSQPVDQSQSEPACQSQACSHSEPARSSQPQPRKYVLQFFGYCCSNPNLESKIGSPKCQIPLGFLHFSHFLVILVKARAKKQMPFSTKRGSSKKWMIQLWCSSFSCKWGCLKFFWLR